MFISELDSLRSARFIELLDDLDIEFTGLDDEWHLENSSTN